MEAAWLSSIELRWSSFRSVALVLKWLISKPRRFAREEEGDFWRGEPGLLTGSDLLLCGEGVLSMVNIRADEMRKILS